ncbi:hypothetical protein [Spirulina subsalsa]|uniref:hypothetical protein n=1 Tax=Spirulina subsalsa TaxID=54311 RepID=UPI00030FE6F2|nr:hypothetical protein [Spirulina subsalsa]
MTAHFTKKRLIFGLISMSAIVGVLLLLWHFIPKALTQNTLTEAKEHLEEWVTESPMRRPNSSALRLQDLGAELGINLDIPFPETYPIPPEKRNQFTEINGDLARYIEALEQSADDQIPPIPESLQNYLTVHRDTLAEIRAHVLSGEPMDWGMHYDLNLDIDFEPNYRGFTGLLNLTHLLTLDAMERNLAGDASTALANLETIAQLNQQIQQKELNLWLNLIISRNIERRLVQNVRKLNNLPQDWQISRSDTVFYRRIANNFQNESALTSWNFLVNMDSDWLEDYGESASLLTRLKFLFIGPYVRLVVADNWRIGQNLPDALSQADFCTTDLEQFKQENPEIKPSGWNYLASEMLQWDSEWLIWAGLVLQWELTDKVQKIKHLAQQEGQFPASITGLNHSICPDSRWVYTVNPDGTASILLEGVPPAFSDPDVFRYQIRQ